MNIGKNLAGSVGSYLPGAITEIFEPSRDFAHLKLPTAGVQSVIALSKYVTWRKAIGSTVPCRYCLTLSYLSFLYFLSTLPQVMVATSDGYLYQYNIDLENGGPCVLLKQFRYDTMEYMVMTYLGVLTHLILTSLHICC